MNDIDFGEYVEDILTRMMNGDDDYRSMIPCYYTPGKKQEKKVAWYYQVAQSTIR